MNAKAAHILADIVMGCSIAGAAISTQPALNASHWVPIACGVLAVIAAVGKGLLVGNIPPTPPAS